MSRLRPAWEIPPGGPARLAGRGQRRQARPLRDQLRPLEPLPGSVVRLRTRGQALLHSRDLCRRHLPPLSQPGRGAFPGRYPGVGAVQPVGQGIGSGSLDFDRNGLLDLWWPRNPARQDLPEPGRVPLRGGGDAQRVRLLRSGPGPGRHGSRRGRRTTTAEGRWPSPTSPSRGSDITASAAAWPSPIRPSRPASDSPAYSPGLRTPFLDYDLDGWQDLLAVNGHIDDLVETVQTRLSYRQRPLLFRNQTDGRFLPMGGEAGPALDQAYAGRGAAAIDYDNDGDLDLVVTENAGPAHLLRNQGETETTGSRSGSSERPPTGTVWGRWSR